MGVAQDVAAQCDDRGTRDQVGAVEYDVAQCPDQEQETLRACAQAADPWPAQP
ncbi:MAG: hypothetical protein P4L92_08830 [Rudaea sp.]|nr:hypothetical protein [Rudaea sp.]